MAIKVLSKSVQDKPFTLTVSDVDFTMIRDGIFLLSVLSDHVLSKEDILSTHYGHNETYISIKKPHQKDNFNTGIKLEAPQGLIIKNIHSKQTGPKSLTFSLQLTPLFS